MGHKAEDQIKRKFVFMMKCRVSGTWEVLVKSSFLWGISMDMWGNVQRVLKVYRGKRIGKRNAEGKKLLKFCAEKELCVANTWFYKAEKKEITNSAGGCETKIDFELVGGRKIQKVCKKCESDSMGISAQAGARRPQQIALKKMVRKQRIITRKIWKLNEKRTRVRFEKRVKELVSTDAPDLWKTFKDGVLKTCDKVCGKKKSKRDREDMW